MSPEKLASIFKNRQGGHPDVRRRTYDVKITINKNGNGRDCMRFAFLNKAAEIAEDYSFVKVSSPELERNKIYFLFSKEKSGKSRDFKRLHRKSESGRYFTVTPDPGIEEKRYRAEWLNHTYSIKYDGECGCYYIENEKEANS
jgi:hypothetical protein